VFKHESAAVHAFAVGAVSPIRIVSLKPAATAALLRVEVVTLIVCIDRLSTAVAPDNKEVTCFWIDFAAHLVHLHLAVDVCTQCRPSLKPLFAENFAFRRKVGRTIPASN
jgi:hypothetical protein